MIRSDQTHETESVEKRLPRAYVFVVVRACVRAGRPASLSPRVSVRVGVRFVTTGRPAAPSPRVPGFHDTCESSPPQHRRTC